MRVGPLISDKQSTYSSHFTQPTEVHDQPQSVKKLAVDGTSKISKSKFYYVRQMLMHNNT